MSNNDDSALRIESLHKRFRVGKQQISALDGVTLSVQTGRITGLIGPDAAGKTTLMRLAAGLLLPDEGRIEVLGLDVQSQSLKVQSGIGYMPQRFGLYEDLSVQQNLDLYADLQSIPKQQRNERYQRLTQMTGLEKFTARLAGQLSGGMQQKLGLACALVRSQKLLLLDEPTVGVDPVSRRELWSIINELVEKEGTTVLISTAYLDEAARCHQVLLLHEGKLLDSGTPDDFRQSMQGRSYRAYSGKLSKRQLNREVGRVNEVIDHVVQSGGVRLLMTSAESAVPELEDVEISPVEASVEDAFVARLIEERKSQSEESVEPASEKLSTTKSEKNTAQNEDEVVIHARNLGRSFGDFQAVLDVDLDIKRGEIFGLIGANGAGKTTTFRMLCGLLPASSGEIAVAGHDVRKVAAVARANIGYMSQKFALYTNLSVHENLTFFAHAYGLSGKRHRQQMQQALEDFSLNDVIDMPSGDLPLGMKQRLALAAALMHSPKILFLDEPTSGVDPLTRRSFWTRINQLAESNVTIMVTTHFLEEAEYCDRLAIMAEGKIVTTDTPEAIRASARGDDETTPDMEEAFIRQIQKKAETASESQ